MATAKNLGIDLGTSGGDWLFRQEGLVLGPVPGTKLVEMLFAGEIDGRTEVAPMGSGTPAFKRLAEVDFFKVHYAKSEAKRRVEVAAAQDQAKQAKSRNVRLAVIGGIALALAAGAAMAARYFAIHNPFQSADDLAFADISVDPPTITVARAHLDDEELVDYPGAGNGAAKVRPKTTPAETAGSHTAVAKAERPERAKAIGSATKAARMSAAADDPDGMQMAEFDQAAINSVVAQKQKSLFPCFKEEAQRTPGLAAKIPLEFVIGNDGRVAKLWIDNPHFKSGPLYECLLRELQKWPFKPYEGERATVNLSFNIGVKR